MTDSLQIYSTMKREKRESNIHTISLDFSAKLIGWEVMV
jgi:hypothetical protein